MQKVGVFNFNATPMEPPGTKVTAHPKKTHYMEQTWSSRKVYRPRVGTL